MRHLLTITTLVILARAAHADPNDPCQLPPRDAVRYWSGAGADFLDTRCNWFPSKSCHLSGYLYKPSATLPNQPAIVFVHGADHKSDQQKQCQYIRFLYNSGYVIFFTYLRGVKDNTVALNGGGDGSDPDHAGFWNTGIDQLDWMDAQNPGDADEKANIAIDYLYEEIDEVQSVFDFLRTLRTTDGRALVASSKIALMGHSFGGSLVTFASDGILSPLPAAIIDMSGAVLDWDSSARWHDSLVMAAFFHQSPILFFQTISESPTGTFASTTQPYQAEVSSGSGDAQAGLYSALPSGLAQLYCQSGDGPAKCAHHAFLRDDSQVARWGPNLIAFLHLHGM